MPLNCVPPSPVFTKSDGTSPSDASKVTRQTRDPCCTGSVVRCSKSRTETMTGPSVFKSSRAVAISFAEASV